MLVLDVIVRTLADAPRAAALWRALDSIRHQAGVVARPIVVVNGQCYDATTMDALKHLPDVVLQHVPEASAGVARGAGRSLVTAPFFAYLDDDDELIADALLQPLQWLDNHPDCDVLVNNGYFVKRDGLSLESTHLTDQANDPARSLLGECWLSPGAFLCRTQGVPIDMLNAVWGHQEWTQLAFELCARRKRLHFMDVKTVRYFDTPGSMSKQTQHQEAALTLLQVVQRDARLTTAVRQAAREKYLRSLHDLAAAYWRLGQRRHAWRCHLGSLRPPYMLDYMLFSRKLLRRFHPVER